jgi:hypothetical protein
MINASSSSAYPTFYPQGSPTFSGIDAVQGQFQSFGLDPALRSSYIPMIADVARVMPYTPPRTPMQNQSQHHGGKKGGHHWTTTR